MTLPSALFVSIHIIAAVLGLGLVTATGIVAGTAPGTPAPETWTSLRRLVVGGTASLALMFLSGIAIEAATGGAWHGTLWFKISFGLTIVVGFFLGQTRRALRKPRCDGIVRNVWIMGVTIAVIAVLMKLKPW